MKQCKLKLRNMKTSFHDAKLNNDKTGNEPNFPPFYEEFESIPGCMDTVKVSKMAEIGCKTLIKKDEIPIVKNSAIKAPEQSAIKKQLNSRHLNENTTMMMMLAISWILHANLLMIKWARKVKKAINRKSRKRWISMIRYCSYINNRSWGKESRIYEKSDVSSNE